MTAWSIAECYLCHGDVLLHTHTIRTHTMHTHTYTPTPPHTTLTHTSASLKGNVILTDFTYTILTLLRTRTDTDTDVRFAVRETFSQDTIKQEQPPPSVDMYARLVPLFTGHPI